jgi:hypothetical protein
MVKDVWRFYLRHSLPEWFLTCVVSLIPIVLRYFAAAVRPEHDSGLFIHEVLIFTILNNPAGLLVLLTKFNTLRRVGLPQHSVTTPTVVATLLIILSVAEYMTISEASPWIHSAIAWAALLGSLVNLLAFEVTLTTRINAVRRRLALPV